MKVYRKCYILFLYNIYFDWMVFNHAIIEEYRDLGILGFISCLYAFILFLQILKCRMNLLTRLISWIISLLVLVLIFYIVREI